VKVVNNVKANCSFANWLGLQEENTQQGIKDLLTTDASTASLHRFLEDKFNIPVGLTAFKSHRKQWCSCR